MGIHNGIITQIFNDFPSGIDLPFAEIKTTKNRKQRKFTMRKNDYNAKYFIFWDFVENIGYICRKKDFHCLIFSNKVNGAIWLSEVIKKAFYSTNSLDELKLKYLKLIKNLI